MQKGLYRTGLLLKLEWKVQGDITCFL